MTHKHNQFARADRLGGVQEYYFSRKLREIGELTASGVDIINLGIGNPDLPPPPAVPAALAGDLRSEKAHGYQSYRGIPRWQFALINWYKTVYNVELAANEVLPLAGSKEGIVHLSLAYLQAGRAILYPDPGYPAYAAAAKLAQGEALPYPMPLPGQAPADWIKTLEGLAEGSDVRLLFVNSPHMPTGQVLSEEMLLALIAFAKTHNILLVSDNAYGYYHPKGPKSLLSLPGARDVAVELNSLSKSHHMPGWRLGVLVGKSEVLDAALQVKSNLDSGQFRPMQVGASVALEVPMSWHKEQWAVISERRQVAEELFSAINCSVPANQAGLFVWAKLPEGQTNSETFCDRILDEARVFMPPGTVFGPGGEGYLRLALCSPVEILEEAKQRCLSIATSL